jgi:hypothetical protein
MVKALLSWTAGLCVATGLTLMVLAVVLVPESSLLAQGGAGGQLPSCAKCATQCAMPGQNCFLQNGQNGPECSASCMCNAQNQCTFFGQ